MSSDAPGEVDGRHFTTYVDRVKELRRNDDPAAEPLLLRLVDATEAESKTDGLGVAPWYYGQLALIYRKRKDTNAEIGILERFAAQEHAPGASPPKLLERLEKLKSSEGESPRT